MKYKVKTRGLFLLRGQHIGIGQELTLTQEEFNRVRSVVDLIETIEFKPKVVIVKRVKPEVVIVTERIEETKPVDVIPKEVEYIVKERETDKKIANLWVKGNRIKFKSINYDKEVSKTIRKYQMKKSRDLESLIDELKSKGFDVSA